jgi:hypothetical protein
MLNKQAIDISFAQGLDTKTDPKRVPVGKFVQLENMVFNKGGLLQKRNGFGQLTSLPDTSYSYLTTFNEDLTAIGPNIAAYSASNAAWVTKGSLEPLSLSTLSVIRNNLNQIQGDIVVSANGLACCVYLEKNNNTTTNKYVIFDANTGQNIIAPTAIPVNTGTVSGGMRVFILGNYFILVFTNTISATPHLQYIAINIATPTTKTANTDIASAYVSATTLSWDGAVLNNYLYIAYNTATGGQSVKIVELSTSLVVSAPTTFLGYTATMMSVTIDSSNLTNAVIYGSFYDSGSSTGYTFAVSSTLGVIMNPVQIISSGTILNITSAAQNGTCSIFYEVSNNYSYDSSIPTHYIGSISVTPLGFTFNSVFSSGASSITASSASGLVNGMYLIDETTPANITAGTTFTISGTTLSLSHNTAGNSAGSPGDKLTTATLSSPIVSIRSVGLASKAFIINGSIYYLAAYQSTYQPSYFLIDGSLSTSASPVIAAKLAYANGGGYITLGLPSVTVLDQDAKIFYLFKDSIQAVNKGTNLPSGTQTAGIYSQTGINLSTFSFGTQNQDVAEVANNLNISGGLISIYDGYLPVELNFLVWPDSIEASWSTSGGSIVAQPDGSTNTNAYYYQVTYEWTDNQGNAFRSAPSIPIPVTTTGSGTSGSITINLPTLRLTMKVANPVKAVIYRWSVGQQEYYQTTSITAPLLNSTTTDQLQFVDTNADATILGNNLIYTTGGVVEDIAPPASNILALFDTRLWLVDAEDPNLLWFSKQIIEATPVEMSDLFTIYVPPITSTETSTGPITALSPMDDKLVIFKENSCFYLNGNGPDNTGANNQYSQATFITTAVGCPNDRSIVLMPSGLMFQSNRKGIWLLDRGLGTEYIGAPVEQFTQNANVTSAVDVPESNQVRFTLDSGIVLMYDYYYQQWGTFVGIPAISSCIYNQYHTIINAEGQVYQENPGTYLDGSNPVLMMFQTGPLRLGDLQNYQRSYFFYILGTYISPHKLQISISYDYELTPSQSLTLKPINFSTPYGSGTSQSPYGQGNPYGGGSSLENWRVFLQKQRCMAFAIQIQEVFDSTFGVPAGAGFNLSGLNVVMGFKQRFRPQAAQTSIG